MGSRSDALKALTLVLAGMGMPALAGGECSEDAVWIRGDFGTVRFSVDVADDDAERAQGLMHVEAMPSSRGMLFVYPGEQPGVAFWMRNTLIPLDMLFADASGTVTKVHAQAIPHDETPIPSGGPAQFVLEINGGLAAQMGIVPGAQLRHPAIEAAAWPCE